MPDMQGVANVIGGFLQGYMGQVQQNENNKWNEVGNLMKVAEHYRQTAEDPYAAPAVFDEARANLAGVASKIDKIINQKSSGLGQILKWIGVGNNPDQNRQAMAQIPREFFSSSKSGPAPMPQPVSTQEPPARMSMAPESENDNVAPYIPIQTQPQTPAAGSSNPFNDIMQFQMNQSGDTGGPQLNARALRMLAEKNLENAGRLDLAKKTAEYQDELAGKRFQLEREQRRSDVTSEAELRDRLERERLTWKTGETEKQIDKNITWYRANTTDTPEEQEKVINHLKLGLPLTGKANWRKMSELDEEGNNVEWWEDLNKVYPPTDKTMKPLSATDLSKIKDYVYTGRAKNFDEAKKLFAEDRINERKLGIAGQNLTNQGRKVLNDSRLKRDEMLSKKSRGELDAKDAETAYKSAMSYGRAMVNDYYRNDYLPEEQRAQKVMDFARSYIEGTGGQPGLFKSWDDMMKLRGSVKSSEELEKDFWGKIKPNTGTGTEKKKTTLPGLTK